MNVLFNPVVIKGLNRLFQLWFLTSDVINIVLEICAKQYELSSRGGHLMKSLFARGYTYNLAVVNIFILYY